MPYFKWHGVHLGGTYVRGRSFAWSAAQLDEQLFKKKIALLKSRPEYYIPVLWKTRVTLVDKIGIFRQLFVLVAAGVLLPEALVIVAEQTRHRQLEEVMHTLALRVQEGEMVSSSIKPYTFLGDSLVVQLLAVGELSGALSSALETIVAYLQAQQDFRAHIMTALFMPSITFGFFVLVVLLIFLLIIPRFADMFASLGHDVPPLTRTMMEISNYVTSWSFTWIAGIVFGSIFTMRLMKKTRQGVWFREKVVLRVPYVNTLIMNQLWGYFFESVGLLLAGGIQLVPALTAVQETISQPFFYHAIGEVVELVKQGHALSYALQALDDQGSCSVSADAIALVRVGQEVGALDTMLKQVAVMYRTKVKKMLSFLTMIVQPLCIIMLGLLILLMIIAIYTPIINMSYVV